MIFRYYLSKCLDHLNNFIENFNTVDLKTEFEYYLSDESLFSKFEKNIKNILESSNYNPIIINEISSVIISDAYKLNVVRDYCSIIDDDENISTILERPNNYYYLIFKTFKQQIRDSEIQIRDFDNNLIRYFIENYSDNKLLRLSILNFIKVSYINSLLEIFIEYYSIIKYYKSYLHLNFDDTKHIGIIDKISQKKHEIPPTQKRKKLNIYYSPKETIEFDAAQKELYHELIKESFISIETRKIDFKNIIYAKTKRGEKINWIGKIGDLFYFIKIFFGNKSNYNIPHQQHYNLLIPKFTHKNKILRKKGRNSGFKKTSDSIILENLVSKFIAKNSAHRKK